jgi:RNA polymerase sigma-70 factor (ECF subfamily)
MDDYFLIQQVIRGNREAFRFLVLRYQRPLFKFLGAYRLEASVREEIAQDTFLRAFDHLGEYDPAKGAIFLSWLFVIGKNLALNELAKASRKREVSEAVEPAYARSADLGASAEVLLEQATEKRRVSEAMAELPTDFRTALTLSYFEGLSLEEVATIEGCATATVKTRVFRAKKLLRLALGNSRKT